jgi:hypothetical protein
MFISKIFEKCFAIFLKLSPSFHPFFFLKFGGQKKKRSNQKKREEK